MKASLACLLVGCVSAWAATVCGQERGEHVQPPSAPERPVLNQPPPQPAPMPADEPEPETPDGPRPPGVGEAGLPGGPRPPVAPVDALLRLIAERRPELAKRLERMRRESPRRLREVVLDALTARLEEALNEAENSPERPVGPRGEGRGVRGGPGERPGGRAIRERGLAERPEFRQRVRELEEQHEQLERHSQELAQKLHEQRAGGAATEELDRLRDELTGVVQHQFEVRTELRKAELQRIEQELQRIREMVGNLQRELEHREKEREAIIQKRIDQLLGQDRTGW
jgi:hypothetical protein